MKKYFAFVIFIFCMTNIHAQENYDWWVNIHHWDGITPWYQYLNFSPKYFGPNALPVPEIQKGVTGDKAIVELAADGHFSKGDKTQNAFTMLYYPIVPKIVAIEGYVVPLEHFKIDTITRDERASRDRDGEGTAGGDIYFGTIVQLVRNKKIPDMALRISLRTASGTNVSAARYTDAPGYFFDLSFGKEKNNKKFLMNKLRWYAMIGFYSWQTNRGDYRQDDSFLYGAGLDLNFLKYIISCNAGGYFGYINNDDRPVVARLQLSRKTGNHFLGINFQKGLNDYPYNSVRLFFRYTLPDAVFLKI
ncbi:MAG TPA: hypothetical protein PKK00_05720 [Bacteroidales bacterium]|nr:hypothetical protein [Bacteroidales bacterium]HPS16338.1 hypothetical protein [Bacteroidales bacterium]